MFDNFKRNQKLKKLNDEKFSFIFDKEIKKNEYIVLDTETTGLNPKNDEILSIGAVKVINNKIITSESFEVFIKPLKEISHESIKIHHITKNDLEHAVPINQALKELLFFIGNLPIVGYYISFDINILNTYLKKYINTTLHNEQIELSSMYYKRFKKQSVHEFVDLKFDTIMQELNLPILGKHDALNDAIMSALMFLKLQKMPVYKGAYS